MTERMFLSHDRLDDWLNEIRQEARLFVPTERDGAVHFEPFDPERGCALGQKPTAPPKRALFPQTETLLRYRYRKDPEHPDSYSLEVEEPEEAGQQVVFGCRPCGAKGFRVFDPLFEEGELADPYYRQKRERTVFITLACEEPENGCFCHWVGGHPADRSGSDILLIPITGGYVVEPVTDRGASLLASRALQQASKEQLDEARQQEEKVSGMLDEAPDMQDVPDKLHSLFEDLDFWRDVSAKCISCGACTYLCPTCYCFNISDEATGLQGKRIRTWDNCMSFLFTLEASGHNPRSTKAHRLRNRVNHKFSYYPRLHEGVFACCGCGRCIQSCPVNVDIREIILRAKETADEEPLSS